MIHGGTPLSVEVLNSLGEKTVATACSVSHSCHLLFHAVVKQRQKEIGSGESLLLLSLKTSDCGHLGNQNWRKHPTSSQGLPEPHSSGVLMVNSSRSWTLCFENTFSLEGNGEN